MKVALQSMLSIRRYLNGKESIVHGTLHQVVGRLLQAIEIHAPQGDEGEYNQFRSNIHTLASRFMECTPPEDMLVIAGEAITNLKEYGERTTRYVKAHSSEYQRMVSMLTHTLLSVTQGSERAAVRLRDIEKQIERASMIDDVRALRMKLDQCLENIREEITEHESRAASSAAELEHVECASPAAPPASPGVTSTDAATGLPDRTAAETAIGNALRQPGHRYLAIAVADRVRAINARFGYAVGDRILRIVSDLFRNTLSSDDHLFRWRGPAIVAILERGPHIQEVRAEIGRIASATYEESIEFANRSVLLPISASWSVLPLSGNLPAVLHKIDQFVAAQAPRE